MYICTYIYIYIYREREREKEREREREGERAVSNLTSSLLNNTYNISTSDRAM